jgi:LuxR family maltose regulon positive regulatory protein
MSVEFPLLATKLFVPPPRANRVGRARLRDRLDAVPGGSVTLVSAAAGSGKSTLLADWALSSDRRVGWVSLDAEDDEPRRFLGYVVGALKSAGALDPDDALGVAGAGTADAIEVAITDLLNAMAARRAAAALVLDDFHVIESDAVHAIVQRIVDHLPPDLHLVVASRVDPPLALSRLRARHMLHEIRGEELRFTASEAERFFNESMGLGLTAPQVAELETKTEGWAVGLQLAAISLRGRDGATGFISGFSGTNRYVLDYLTDEVLHRQPDDVRRFLLETSVLGKLSARLCEAVTGRPGAEAILQRLDVENLFLIPLDDVRVWYRYHHLFASLLRHELERTTPREEVSALHRRASGWFEANGMPEPALHHALAARDEERAIGIVTAHARTRIVGGDSASIVRWVSQLPRERVERDLELLLTHALALTAECRFEEALREVEIAGRLVPPGDEGSAAGGVLSMRGLLYHLTGDIEKAFETLDRAMRMLVPGDFWHSMTSFNLGMASFMVPDLRKAEAYFLQATSCRDRSYGLLTAVLGQCYAGWCLLWRGLPEDAVKLVREAKAWTDAWSSDNLTGSPLAALVYSMLADLHRMRNELDEARESARLALEAGRKGFFLGYAEGTRVLAQVSEEQGDFDTAIHAARETLRGFRYAGNPYWLGTARALEYHVLWRRGVVTGSHADLETVARWCEEGGYLDVDHWSDRMHGGLFPDFTLMIAANVLAYQQRYDEARRLLDALSREATSSERVPAQITTLVQSALVAAAVGEADEAVATMRRALELASGPGFIRFFLNEGTAVVPLVERAMQGMCERGFAARVLAAFDVPVKPRLAVTGISEPLTEREIEVLRLIAEGASNQEAARRLIVAPSTVKKHLENVYAKLGVAGRSQAVARARELRLI